MNNTVTYASKSICNLVDNQIVTQTGDVTKNSNGSIELGKNSKCAFEYTYDSTLKMKFDSLKVVCTTSEDSNTMISRYNNNVRVEIEIDYYKEDINENGVYQGYIAGKRQFIRFYPYFTHEEEVKLGSQECLCQGDLYVKRILIEFVYENGASNSVTFNKFLLYNSRTTSQVVTDTYGLTIALAKVVGYTDGCRLYYDGEETPTTLQWQDDGTGVFTGVKVNPGEDNEKLITFERKNQILDIG